MAWKDAAKLADSILAMLGLPEHEVRVYVTRREGDVPGYRVVVTRMTDGVSSTAFAPDNPEPKEG